MVSQSCPEEWSDWVDWLSAGLHGRNRWRLGVIFLGMLFAFGRRTVTTWLRAAGISTDYPAYYYFIGAVGRNGKAVATRLCVLLLRQLPIGDRVVAVIDDSPTKRYGPKVEGADKHHNPTPGPADQPYLYGHIWVTIALAVHHSCWGTIALPLLALLYVRRRTVGKLRADYQWEFQTKLELALRLTRWLASLTDQAGKKLWVVVDGFYAKRPFLRPAIAAGVVIVSRLRKDAALYDVPLKPKKGGRGPGRPRKYGKNRISLRRRAAHRHGWRQLECMVYGRRVVKTYKTFQAAYPPVGGEIRVVIVKEERGCQFWFCTDPDASVREIIEAFADRASIEQDFHDVKEVWGAGQQQVRNLWANIGAFNLNLWMYTLVELWAWDKPKHEICDRSASPWDDPDRHPSHADRRNALRRLILRQQFSALCARNPISKKIRRFTERLINLAT